MSKYAVFTMDVEAFSDTECLKKANYVSQNEMFDGIDNYLALLDKYNIKAELFVVCDSLNQTKSSLLKAIKNGHKIGVHGLSHTPPLLLDKEVFKEKISKAKETLEKELNIKVKGHRAPCFSINEERLDILNEIGINYDTSYLNNPYTYYNGHLTMDNFNNLSDAIYCKNGFYEFSMPTIKKLPICGGGYFRIAPWILYKGPAKRYLKSHELFIFYLHPFEVSNVKIPKIKKLKSYDHFYLNYNRNKNYIKKVEKLIKLLIKCGYEFTTFEDIIKLYKSK